jgi:hypothetical protein
MKQINIKRYAEMIHMLLTHKKVNDVFKNIIKDSKLNTNYCRHLKFLIIPFENESNLYFRFIFQGGLLVMVQNVSCLLRTGLC